MPLERHLAHYDGRKLWIEQKSEEQWEISIEYDVALVDSEGKTILFQVIPEMRTYRTLETAKRDLTSWAKNTPQRSGPRLVDEPEWRDLTER